MREDPAPGPAASPPATASRCPGTVLLVEDDDRVRGLVRAVLEGRGHVVHEAASGEDAWRLVERGASFDLLLTDVVLPGLSGPELARRLLPLRPGLKVLYASGFTSGELQPFEAVASNAAFLEKPFTPGALLEQVRELLEG